MIPSATAPVKGLYKVSAHKIMAVHFCKLKKPEQKKIQCYQISGNNSTLRTGSPWFAVLDSFMAFICALAARPAADLSYSSCLQVDQEDQSQLGQR
jgi:hypothetical protein